MSYEFRKKGKDLIRKGEMKIDKKGRVHITEYDGEGNIISQKIFSPEGKELKEINIAGIKIYQEVN